MNNVKCRGIRLLISVIAAACAACCFSYVAQAQQDLGIPTGVQISPSRFDWDLEDGMEKTGVINLKNYSDETHEVDIAIEDFFVSDDSTEARFFVPNENHPLYAYDVINWIDCPKHVTLGPKEGKDISFTVKVPEKTPTGGYYGAAFFMNKAHDATGDPEGKSKILVNQRVGTLLVMAVKGDEPIRRSGELKTFQTSKKVYLEKPVKFLAETMNSGNLQYKAFGKIEIHKFGKKIDTIELVPRMLYPGKIRRYERDWNFSSWSYGFYRAKFEMLSEDQEIRMVGEITFWVIPWKSTVSIIVLLIIIWLIIKIFTSKYEIKLKSKDDDENGGDDAGGDEKGDGFHGPEGNERHLPEDFQSGQEAPRDHHEPGPMPPGQRHPSEPPSRREPKRII